MLEEKVRRKFEWAKNLYLGKVADVTHGKEKKKWQGCALIVEQLSHKVQSASEASHQITARIELSLDDISQYLRDSGLNVKVGVVGKYIGIIRKDTGIVCNLNDYQRKTYVLAR